VVESGQMRTGRLGRRLVVAGVCVTLGLLPWRPVSTAPPERQDVEHRGACYCRAMGELKCVGVVTKPACDKQCAEALCDDWFWMERLTCWNWGYGG
jgi:hypothetical protein